MAAALGAFALSCSSGDGTNLRPPVEDGAAPAFQSVETTFTAPTSGSTAEVITLTTPSMTPEGPMPIAYTCFGEGVSPPLAWAGIPAETVEIVITAEELGPDTTIRWLLAGIDPSTTGIAEGRVPQGAESMGGLPVWSPPCPEEGESRTVIFTLYAVASDIDLTEAATPEKALEIVQLASVAQAAATTLTG